MTKITSSLLTLACLLALAFSAVPSHALNTRSFISAFGNDANPCTRPLPCRTLQKAHDSTNPNGEINVLDPAGYGTVIINKSISIVNDGVGSAGILVPAGQNGIIIDAGANDVVNLRGLIIEGAGLGLNGIRFRSGRFLTIEHCVVRGMQGVGIILVPTVVSMFAISDTYVANNSVGIYLSATSSSVSASFNRVELYKNGETGKWIDATLNHRAEATVLDSIAAHHSSYGFRVDGGGLGALGTTVSFIRSTAAHNGSSGFVANGAGATALAGQSVATQNPSGNAGAANGATMYTYGDNYFDGGGGCISCTATSKG